MMTSALGKVRTAGTFSFVIGVVAFFAMATAYLIWATLKENVYKNWLIVGAGISLLIGIVVSGSRSVVGACAVVAAALGLVLFVRPAAVNRAGRAVVVTVIVGFLISHTPVFKEGLNVLTTRFTEAAEATEQSVTQGMISRALSGFTEGVFVLGKSPFLGYGLGIGTNAGAKFLTGRSIFLLSEGEWSRIFLESGPVLGLAYVIWRCAIVGRIGVLCVRSARFGNILPLLLFSSSFLAMLNGQFGQPTVLGFSVFVTGLALAARDIDEDAAQRPKSHAGKTVSLKRVATRSAYASRIHGTAANPHDTNGSTGG